MPHVTEYAPGTPSWVDLGTPDPGDAARFYSHLFDWTIHEGPPETGGYRMCMYDDRPVAGIGPQLDPAVPPWWTTYITVTDVDATAAAIVANGGTLEVEPLAVLDAGRLAVAADPSGATFSVWQPGTHIGAGIVNDANTFCWNELTTRDKDGSIAFYSAVFGWRPHHHGDSAADYVEFHLDDRSVAGLMPMAGGGTWPTDRPTRGPNFWLVYFAVDDVDETAARAIELGGLVALPPTEILPGRFAVVTDAQGAMFSIITFHQEAA
jgi:predicted enzyme related to lactoylglutathione lyase